MKTNELCKKNTLIPQKYNHKNTLILQKYTTSNTLIPSNNLHLFRLYDISGNQSSITKTVLKAHFNTNSELGSSSHLRMSSPFAVRSMWSSLFHFLQLAPPCMEQIHHSLLLFMPKFTNYFTTHNRQSQRQNILGVPLQMQTTNVAPPRILG